MRTVNLQDSFCIQFPIFSINREVFRFIFDCLCHESITLKLLFTAEIEHTLLPQKKDPPARVDKNDFKGFLYFYIHFAPNLKFGAYIIVHLTTIVTYSRYQC